jgi:hypothetical protein
MRSKATTPRPSAVSSSHVRKAPHRPRYLLLPVFRWEFRVMVGLQRDRLQLFLIRLLGPEFRRFACVEFSCCLVHGIQG